MIELDKDGNIPQLKQCRVYIVSGFKENRPFKGFNIWTDTSPRTLKDIEGYDTFHGWATEILDASAFVVSTTMPARPHEFRVGVLGHDSAERSPYPFIETGETRDSLEQSLNFRGWLTQVVSVTLPEPVPKVLMRFRKETEHGRIDGMYVTTRSAHSASLSRQANFGRQLGLQSDLVLTLESSNFLQMSDNQTEIEALRRNADAAGTLCGLNPLVHLV